MANHGFVNFDGEVPELSDITNVLESFLQEKFNGFFEIEFEEKENRWWVDKSENDSEQLSELGQVFWLNENDQIEIRHGHYSLL